MTRIIDKVKKSAEISSKMTVEKGYVNQRQQVHGYFHLTAPAHSDH